MKTILFLIFIIYNIHADNFKGLLFNGNCTTCHFINKSISAPSMKSVQQVYKKAFPNEKDFIEYMSTWVVHPNTSGSLMHNAIDKYKLMPELGFDKSTIREITEYIYNLE